MWNIFWIFLTTSYFYSNWVTILNVVPSGRLYCLNLALNYRSLKLQSNWNYREVFRWKCVLFAARGCGFKIELCKVNLGEDGLLHLREVTFREYVNCENSWKFAWTLRVSRACWGSLIWPWVDTQNDVKWVQQVEISRNEVWKKGIPTVLRWKIALMLMDLLDAHFVYFYSQVSTACICITRPSCGYALPWKVKASEASRSSGSSLTNASACSRTKVFSFFFWTRHFSSCHRNSDSSTRGAPLDVPPWCRWHNSWTRS